MTGGFLTIEEMASTLGVSIRHARRLAASRQVTRSTSPLAMRVQWRGVADLSAALPAGSWTLVGELMVQLHNIRHGIGIVRPTNDVDIVLHIESNRGVPDAVAGAL